MNHYVDNDFINKAVNQYSDMIIRIAFQHTLNKADAEDIMQDVLVLLIEQPPFNDEEHIKAWLIRVTINKSLDYIKSIKRRKTIALTDQYGYEKEDIEIIDEIQKLNETDRDVIYLFYFEGYSAKEIADIIGKKENAIFTQLKRARKKLKLLLEDSK